MLCDVVLPLAIEGVLTYSIPSDLQDHTTVGMRVLVPIGKKKIQTGIITNVHALSTNEQLTNSSQTFKPIIGFVDEYEIVTNEQLRLWEWIANYYMCSLGEVMKAALPSALKLESETRVRINEDFEATKRLHPTQEKILDFLSDCKPHNIDAINKSVGLKNTLPQLQKLMDIGAIVMEEYVKQVKHREKTLLQDSASTVCNINLSPLQSKVKQQIIDYWQSKQVVLLHGITGSGKTEVYCDLAWQELNNGRSVLYLVPEIALTTQLTQRLRKLFGDRLLVYHSRFSDVERVQVYNAILRSEKPYILLGVRSSVFLPFRNLGLIVVDEEHDLSYKQTEPSPRYHCRNTAIVLAQSFHAKVLLGSATPSLESYFNAQRGKYALVELLERYKDAALPEIDLINTRLQYHRKEMTGHFADQTIAAISQQVKNHRQIIVFQNRRGFAPYIECKQCAYIPKCVNCDVSLTVHKYQNILSCHYCGYTIPIPKQCPACGQDSMTDRGIGTEKVEDELKSVFSETKISRMDLDTTRNKNNYQKIIDDFAEHKTDILVGTQMLTKGLDFNDVGMVTVLSADTLLNQPDFRSEERTFQMLEQVSGRAGRRQEKGQVIIQTTNPDNRILKLVKQHDYKQMYSQQIEERRLFKYPPFYHILTISIRHRDLRHVQELAQNLQLRLKSVFTHRCSGVIQPAISKVQNMYLRQIVLKIAATEPYDKAKGLLSEQIALFRQDKFAKQAHIIVDVD